MRLIIVLLTIVCVLVHTHTVETGIVYFNTQSRTDQFVTTLKNPASSFTGTPIVIAYPLRRGDDLFRIRASASRDDDNDLIEINFSIIEFLFTGGVHNSREPIAYVVLDEGLSVLSDGTVIQAGITAISSDASQEVLFSSTFSCAPVVISGTLVDSCEPIITRLDNVEAAGFSIHAQREEAEADNPVNDVAVSWIAVEPTTTSSLIRSGLVDLTDASTTVEFGLDTIRYVFTQIQTFQDSDPAWSDMAGGSAFNVGTSSVNLRIQEETSNDTETSHATESVGYIFLTDLFMEEKTELDFPAETLFLYTDSASREFAIPTAFSMKFDDPIIKCQVLNNGDTGAGVTDISTEGFNFHLIEAARRDGDIETPIAADCLVMERGVFDIESTTESQIQADSVTVVPDVITEVSYTLPFGDTFGVIVLAQVVGITRPYTVRAFDTTSESFSLNVQTDPNDSGDPAEEVTVHWIAIYNDPDDDTNIFMTGEDSGSADVKISHDIQGVTAFAAITSNNNESPCFAVIDSFNIRNSLVQIDVFDVDSSDERAHGTEDVAAVVLSLNLIGNLAEVDIPVPDDGDGDDTGAGNGDGEDGEDDEAGDDPVDEGDERNDGGEVDVDGDEGNDGGKVDVDGDEGAENDENEEVDTGFLDSTTGIAVVAGSGALAVGIGVFVVYRRRAQDYDFSKLDGKVFAL